MTRAEREEQRQVLERLRRDGHALAVAYRLPLQSIEPERPQVKRRYGICYSDGRIQIRLRNVRTGGLLKYSSMIDTLCHELAHLRHFDHSPRFYAFYERVLGYARRRGIYRPGTRRSCPAAWTGASSEGAASGRPLGQGTLFTTAELGPRRRPEVREREPTRSGQLELFPTDRPEGLR